MLNAASIEIRCAHWLKEQLLDWGVNPDLAAFANLLLMLGILIVLILLIDFFTRRWMLNFLTRLAKNSETTVDDVLVEKRVFKQLAHVVPAVLAKASLGIVFADYPAWIAPLKQVIDVYIIIAIVLFIQSVLRALKVILLETDVFKDKPIGAYTQLINIINWILGVLFVISELSGQPLWSLFTAFGALSAILILTFKDTILGFVSSIQISGNDIVRVNDWITMEKYGADGNVIEINLTTVKVRNFDKTITTIPTYAFTADSFKNWRGMEEGEGRRIKRAVHVKISSVRFIGPDMYERLQQIQLIQGPLAARQAEIEAYNQQIGANKTLEINGRQMTNLGVFRMYMAAYIEQHPLINPELTRIIRQLQATDKGIPMEVYCFTKDKEWATFEGIMADIFDHLYASVGLFGLEIFESPTGRDFASLRQN
ncbi:MAG: mechanosensitive ion channel family protein [Bacteroidia bacterium]